MKAKKHIDKVRQRCMNYLIHKISNNFKCFIKVSNKTNEGFNAWQEKDVLENLKKLQLFQNTRILAFVKILWCFFVTKEDLNVEIENFNNLTFYKITSKMAKTMSFWEKDVNIFNRIQKYQVNNQEIKSFTLSFYKK